MNGNNYANLVKMTWRDVFHSACQTTLNMLPLYLHLRIIKFPNTLNVEDTRKAISIAFNKWSDVSPLTFTEVTNGNATTDITIGMSHNTKGKTAVKRYENTVYDILMLEGEDSNPLL